MSCALKTFIAGAHAISSLPSCNPSCFCSFFVFLHHLVLTAFSFSVPSFLSLFPGKRNVLLSFHYSQLSIAFLTHPPSVIRIFICSGRLSFLFCFLLLYFHLLKHPQQSTTVTFLTCNSTRYSCSSFQVH